MNILYTILIVLLLSALLAGYLFQGRVDISNIATNLATELFGILITVSVVQYLLNRDAELKALRVSRGGFRKAGYGINRFLTTVTMLLKGALEPDEKTKLRCLDDFRNPDLLNVIDGLDIGSPWDKADPKRHTWAEHLSGAIHSLRDGAQNSIDLYSDFFPRKYLELLDEVCDNEYLRYLQGIGQLVREDLGDYPNRTIFAPNAGKKERVDFFNLFCDLIALHNRFASNTIVFPSEVLEDVAFPEWGQLRIAGHHQPIVWRR